MTCGIYKQPGKFEIIFTFEVSETVGTFSAVLGENRSFLCEFACVLGKQRWKGGVSLQWGRVFFCISQIEYWGFFSFQDTIIHLCFSVHFFIALTLFRDLRVCDTFYNVVYTSWNRAIYNPGLIKCGGRKLTQISSFMRCCSGLTLCQQLSTH